MFVTAEMDVVDTGDIDLTIVASPDRDGWAVVDRFGRVVSTGDYTECLRHMGRLAPHRR